MRIKGAWNVKAYPDLYIAELENDELRAFLIRPFRILVQDDIRVIWNDIHPLELRGEPMPDHLYEFYGLEKIIERETIDKKKVLKFKNIKR